MQQIYKEMKKPIEEMKKRNGNGNQSFGTLTDYFENNTMSELFEKNAGSVGGGVGLAKMLYESMKRNRAYSEPNYKAKRSTKHSKREQMMQERAGFPPSFFTCLFVCALPFPKRRG